VNLLFDVGGGSGRRFTHLELDDTTDDLVAFLLSGWPPASSEENGGRPK
jgi:hypothetical protein